MTGEGIDDLLQAIGDRLRSLTNVVELFVPFDRGDVLASVHREGEVLVEAVRRRGHAPAGAARRRRGRPAAGVRRAAGRRAD